MRAASVFALVATALLAGCGRATYRAELSDANVVDLGSPLADVIAAHGRPDSVVPLGSGTFALEYRKVELDARVPGRVRGSATSLAYLVKREKVIAPGTLHDQGTLRGASVLPGAGPLAPRSAFPTVALGLAAVLGFAVAHGLGRRARRAAVKLGVGLALVGAGTFGHELRGPDRLDAVSEGSPAGELIRQHGAPDETLELPDGAGLLVTYARRDRRDDVLWGSDETSTLTYLVQAGRVARAGPVVHELSAQYAVLPFYECAGGGSPDAATLARTLALFGIVLALVARRIERRSRGSAAPASPSPAPPAPPLPT